MMMRIGLKTKKQKNILGQGHLSLPAKGLSSSDSPCPDLKLSKKQIKKLARTLAPIFKEMRRNGDL